MPTRDARAPGDDGAGNRDGSGRAGADPARRAIGFAPGRPLAGRVDLPGSKSLAQRLLVVASLTRGTTRLANVPAGDDVRAALALVAACGATVERDADDAGRVTISADAWRPPSELSVGESGTLARFATALLALAVPAGTTTRLTATGTLLRRTSAPLFHAIALAGARVRHLGLDGGWPVEITACDALPREIELVSPVSSQEASALAIAAAVAVPATTLKVRGTIPSEPYFAMTLAVLERFGLTVHRRPRGGEDEVRFTGKWTAPVDRVVVEPDASSAAVALVAACISGGEIAVGGLGADSLQGDIRIAEHLAAFGCRVYWQRDALVAGGRPTRRAELDLAGEPDLAPPLAALAAARALAAAAPEPASVLRGLDTLPRKESDRLDAMALALERLGFEIERGAAHLSIGRGSPAIGALELDARDDHRIVFFLALLGLARDGVRILDTAAIAKSWPRFFDDLGRLGASVVRSGGAAR